MKIFRVKADTNNVNQLCPTDLSRLDDLEFDGISKKNDWEVLEIYNQSPRIRSKHFFSLTLGVLVCNNDAFSKVQTLFEIGGEVLDIRMERTNEILYLYNNLEYLNCLDYTNTIWDYYADGQKGRILKLAFLEERIGTVSSLFKIPETGKNELYTVSDFKNNNDEFYHIYQTNNLTGLVFDLIQEF